MTLEQKVRKEVDKWDITVKTPKGHVSYESKIKSFYYGMGIALTEKSVALYSQNRNPQAPIKKYTSLGFNDAVEEFKIDFIIQKYLEIGSVRETAKVLAVGDNETTGRVILCQILNRNGLTFNEVKLNPNKYNYLSNNQEFNINDEIIVNNIYEEMKEYSELIKPILFQKLLINNARKMAIRFASIAKEIVKEDVLTDIINLEEYKAMTLKEASECFKIKYLTQQFFDADMNAHLAAEKAGISYDSYKEHMSRRKISLNELKK